MLAGFGQSANNFFGDLRIQGSGGQVVHEKQRRRTLHRDVVDTVIHQVAADGVMHAHVEGDFQLGAHAIDARNQHRIQILFVDREQPAESADFAQHSLGEGFVGQILDALLGAVATIDADTGIGVGDGVGWEVGVLSHFFVRRC